MFRELQRKNRRLPSDECAKLLKNEKRGVLSVTGEMQYPYGMPMNHYYNEEDGCIYFHCGRSGHRLDSLRKSDKVSFCVYDSGVRNEGEWALNIKSVIVFGRVEIIDDCGKVAEITKKLCYKFTDDEGYIENEISKYAKATLLLKLTPEHICGKLVNEA